MATTEPKKKPNGYQVCGANRLEYQFIFQKQPNLRLHFVARTTCVGCSRGLEVPYGIVATDARFGNARFGSWNDDVETANGECGCAAVENRGDRFPKPSTAMFS